MGAGGPNQHQSTAHRLVPRLDTAGLAGSARYARESLQTASFQQGAAAANWRQQGRGGEFYL